MFQQGKIFESRRSSLDGINDVRKALDNAIGNLAPMLRTVAHTSSGPIARVNRKAGRDGQEKIADRLVVVGRRGVGWAMQLANNVFCGAPIQDLNNSFSDRTKYLTIDPISSRLIRISLVLGALTVISATSPCSVVACPHHNWTCLLRFQKTLTSSSNRASIKPVLTAV